MNKKLIEYMQSIKALAQEVEEAVEKGDLQKVLDTWDLVETDVMRVGDLLDEEEDKQQ